VRRLDIDKLYVHRRILKFDAQLNSESFRQDEFKDEPAERTIKNSLGSILLNDAVPNLEVLKYTTYKLKS